MKKVYSDPELIVEIFATEDILADSSVPGIDEDEL